MENIDPLLGIIIVVFGILNLILFFKMWGMTNDVRAIKNHFIKEEKPTISENVTTDDGWAEDATDQEKREAGSESRRFENGKERHRSVEREALRCHREASGD